MHNDEVRQTTKQPRLLVIVQPQRFSMFGRIARLSDETDTKKMLTASPWRTGGDHLDMLVLRGWRLFSKTWNPVTFAWMKQSTWLRIVHSGDWCLRLVICTPSGVCQKWYISIGIGRTTGPSTEPVAFWIEDAVMTTLDRQQQWLVFYLT